MFVVYSHADTNIHWYQHCKDLPAGKMDICLNSFFTSTLNKGLYRYLY